MKLNLASFLTVLMDVHSTNIAFDLLLVSKLGLGLGADQTFGGIDGIGSLDKSFTKDLQPRL